MNTPLPTVAIAGAAGRMGRSLVELGHRASELRLVAAFEAPGNPLLGQDVGAIAGIGPIGIPLTSDASLAELPFDVLIDFTTVEASLAHLETCVQAGRRVVLGTTGFGERRALIDAAATRIGIVFAPNMSVGVNLCFKLLALAARVLGDDFDVEIIEAHHRHKVDAPSGTAVRMGEILAAELGRDLASCAVYGRQGHTGPRERKTIGFETVRAGEIVGDHTVLFAGAGEVLEITHRAANRANFAGGALRAAAWLASRGPGCYDMQDVLGLR